VYDHFEDQQLKRLFEEKLGKRMLGNLMKFVSLDPGNEKEADEEAWEKPLFRLLDFLRMQIYAKNLWIDWTTFSQDRWRDRGRSSLRIVFEEPNSFIKTGVLTPVVEAFFNLFQISAKGGELIHDEDDEPHQYRQQFTLLDEAVILSSHMRHVIDVASQFMAQGSDQKNPAQEDELTNERPLALGPG